MVRFRDFPGEFPLKFMKFYRNEEAGKDIIIGHQLGHRREVNMPV